ncbi:MAG: glycosyltransferase, partial [Alphaproteobacteria bacterium]|nr:glycosyltransferase [Alphaproteobacteria bacterium]
MAVVIPCLNEEVAIARVVNDFRAALPSARIYVYDNASSDATASRARDAGAIVRAEPMRGKGNVVRRMFADVEAEIYVMADGDGTYDAARAPALVERLIADRLDMVVGTRLGSHGDGLFRGGHRLGNRALSWLAGRLFHRRLADVLSGYRVFSRRFVKSFPALSAGFEIETELTLHALELRLPIAEAETDYGARPEGSASKLNTLRDGIRILWRLMILMKELKPLVFFGAIAALLALVSVILAWPIFATFMATGLVPRIPTSILATG